MGAIEQVAKALGKTPQTIRVGLQYEKFPFGIAYKNKHSSRYSYFLWPPLVRQYVGIDIGNEKEIEVE